MNVIRAAFGAGSAFHAPPRCRSPVFLPFQMPLPFSAASKIPKKRTHIVCLPFQGILPQPVCYIIIRKHSLQKMLPYEGRNTAWERRSWF
ncbi:MAG: hypothetical protein ACLVAA_11460 [Ruthenibacterium sp.]